ncbi:MAG: IS3 family transposase [Candidatus Dormibacteria bacterium]
MTKRRSGAGGPGSAGSDRGRWSSGRKMNVVLRLLRGEDLDGLSRELGVTGAAMAQWRDQFLGGGQAALRSRESDERDLEVSRMKTKIGEITMENELLRERARRAEGNHPLGVEEVEAVSRTISSSAGRAYGLAFACRVLEIPRSTVYAAQARALAPAEPARKRGPKTVFSDQELTEQIRAVLSASPWLGEGYRKAWAQLRRAGIRTSQARVLRLMREAQLLAPTRDGRAHGPKAHDGTITTDRPDEMWGTDATSTLTGEGQATIFIAVDHCTQECIGIHAALRGTRFEALEPIRQGIRERYGVYQEKMAQGLLLRHDNGSQYCSRYFQDELRFLGIESSPAYVREPEGNGVVERFNRTVKEQLLWVQRFDTVAELLDALHLFKQRYNQCWLVAKHNYSTPAAARVALTLDRAA